MFSCVRHGRQKSTPRDVTLPTFRNEQTFLFLEKKETRVKIFLCVCVDGALCPDDLKLWSKIPEPY